jgi:benzodiazapine receptor
VVAWLLIFLAMVAVTLLIVPSSADYQWFQKLRRPDWCRFEGTAPLLAAAIYLCFYGSAVLVWETLRPREQPWPWMAAYLLLVVLVQSGTWVICRTRRLATGTAMGFVGWIWGMALTVMVASINGPAAALLLPYLIWSPIGSLLNWQMERLNR